MSTETPQDRVRASIALKITEAMAEGLLQYDKANPAYKLVDLRDANERAVFIADIMELLSPERRAERANRLHTLRSHAIALAGKEQSDVEWQARQDVIEFGDRRHDQRPAVLHFGAVAPGYCWVCTERVDDPTDASTLQFSATLKADVHASCCLKDEQRFEITAAYAFRLRDGAR